MWDLVPQPGIKPGPRALGVQSLTHWRTTEVPHKFLKIKFLCMSQKDDREFQFEKYWWHRQKFWLAKCGEYERISINILQVSSSLGLRLLKKAVLTFPTGNFLVGTYFLISQGEHEAEIKSFSLPHNLLALQKHTYFIAHCTAEHWCTFSHVLIFSIKTKDSFSTVVLPAQEWFCPPKDIW